MASRQRQLFQRHNEWCDFSIAMWPLIIRPKGLTVKVAPSQTFPWVPCLGEAGARSQCHHDNNIGLQDDRGGLRMRALRDKQGLHQPRGTVAAPLWAAKAGTGHRDLPDCEKKWRGWLGEARRKGRGFWVPGRPRTGPPALSVQEKVEGRGTGGAGEGTLTDCCRTEAVAVDGITHNGKHKDGKERDMTHVNEACTAHPTCTAT